jgi:hypothetical protein
VFPNATQSVGEEQASDHTPLVTLAPDQTTPRGLGCAPARVLAAPAPVAANTTSPAIQAP